MLCRVSIHAKFCLVLRVCNKTNIPCRFLFNIEIIYPRYFPDMWLLCIFSSPDDKLLVVYLNVREYLLQFRRKFFAKLSQITEMKRVEKFNSPVCCGILNFLNMKSSGIIFNTFHDTYLENICQHFRLTKTMVLVE